MLLDAPSDEKIANEIFNVGYISRTCRSWTSRFWSSASSRKSFPEKGEIGIVTTPSDDKRSYHINSDKVRRVKPCGYAPKRTIEEAVRSLCRAFKDGSVCPTSMAWTTFITMSAE